MSEYASRELDKVIVRLPNGMRDKLKLVAKKQNRTMNAEIVKRLEFTFEADLVAYELGGYDAGLSVGTPEWTAAIAKRDESEATPANSRQMSDADLDYVVEKLSARFKMTVKDEDAELQGGASRGRAASVTLK